MGEILQDMNGSADVPCNVGFVRRGMFSSSIRGTIRTKAEVIDLAGELVKEFGPPFLEGSINVIAVVDRINWCEGTLNPDGCTYTFNNNSFSFSIVERNAANQGIVWAHEFGHIQGLKDRPADDRHAVMNGTVVAVSRRVDEEECSAYRIP